MPCKRCAELSFKKDALAEIKQTFAKQSQLIKILRGDLAKDITELDKRIRKASSEGVKGMAPAEANQLMKDLAERAIKQKTQIEGYQHELGGVDFTSKQFTRTTIMMADETKRKVAALQDEIKALDVRLEEEKRKAIGANLKLAQAGRMVEKVERALSLDSPKGSSIDKRLANVDVSFTATIDDFAELKKRVAKDSDVVAASGPQKQLVDLRSELKREKTAHANAKSEAEEASKQLLLVSAQRDQSDAKIVDLKNDIRRLKERFETKISSKT